MRCLRNKIHSNLFLAFVLSNTFWIIIAIMQSIHFTSRTVEFSWCVFIIFNRYFHLATFFWMFVEGMAAIMTLKYNLGIELAMH